MFISKKTNIHGTAKQVLFSHIRLCPIKDQLVYFGCKSFSARDRSRETLSEQERSVSRILRPRNGKRLVLLVFIPVLNYRNIETEERSSTTTWNDQTVYIIHMPLLYFSFLPGVCLHYMPLLCNDLFSTILSVYVCVSVTVTVFHLSVCPSVSQFESRHCISLVFTFL